MIKIPVQLRQDTIRGLGAKVLADAGLELADAKALAHHLARAGACNHCAATIPTAPVHVCACGSVNVDLTQVANAAEPTNERAGTEDQPLVTLLFVAEIAAKIIYNASAAPAPFDHDSGWWMARCLRQFVLALPEVARAEQEAWSVLTAPLAGPRYEPG